MGGTLLLSDSFVSACCDCFILISYGYYQMIIFLVKGPGLFYVKAFALRGTLYTLISKVDEAIEDLTQVIDADDENVSTKVCTVSHQGEVWVLPT